jgi:hypothetical protein
MKNIYPFFVMFFCLILQLHAQDGLVPQAPPVALNCATFVKDLEQEFNSGHYDACFQMFRNGTGNCKFSKRESEDIWLISAQINLERGNLQEVRKSFVQVLKNNPLYVPKQGAFREDFYSNYKMIKVRPRILAGVHSGVNLPSFKTTAVYSVLDSVNYDANLQGVPGYQAGIFLEYLFLPNLSIASEIDYTTVNYKRALSGPGSRFSLDYAENLTYADLHFSLKKYFGQGKLKPYVSGGACLSFLQKATSQVSVRYSRTDPYTKDIDHFTSEATTDLKAMRNQRPGFLSLGAGCSYRLKNCVLSLDARYLQGLSNFVNPDRRQSNPNLLYNFYYVDNDVTLRKLEISVGIAYVLNYSVKERKRHE